MATVRKFPYGLRFRVDGDAILIACLHGSRDRRLAQEPLASFGCRPGPFLTTLAPKCYSLPISLYLEQKKSGGEGGIRTPGRVFDPTTV